MSNLKDKETEAETNEDGQPPKEEIRLDVDRTGPSSPMPNIAENQLACGDRRRDEYRTVRVRLYQAAMTGDWEAAKAIIEKQKDIVRATITSHQETALHIAVSANHTGFVKNLLQKMEKDDLTLQNVHENTALCFAASCGATDIAEMLIRKNEGLPMIRGARMTTPIHMAALFGHGKMVRFLYEKTKLEDLTDEELRYIFLDIIKADIYDVALKMFEDNKISSRLVALYGTCSEETGLHLMARKPSSIAHKKQLNLFQRLANSIFEGVFHEAKMRTFARQLVEKLWESAIQLPKKKLSILLKSPSHILFDAARYGNVELLVILIRSYPDLIWTVNEAGLTLFHIAAKYRHENVFNIIYELGGIKYFLTLHKEITSAESLLHMVAYLPPPNRQQTVSGAALEMQREILWFKAVEKIVPVSYIEDESWCGQVAYELFAKQHEGLLMEGEKWMKSTATSCMLAATLIATVVFAAAFTIPGGNEDKTGFPNFRKELWFDIFVISNSVALFSSVISVAIFLSILTSRYAVEDFVMSLPSKLMLGLLALFVSIISMIITFTVALVLIQHREPSWSLILITCLASLTSLSYALLHTKLLCEAIHAYVLKFIYHRRKGLLYS